MDKDRVLSTMDYLQWYRNYVPTLKEPDERGEAKGLCPFHPEKNPSFSVNSKSGKFHCFGCGKSGNDPFSFLAEIEHFDIKADFSKIVARVAREAGMEDKPVKSKVVATFSYLDEAFQVVYWKERVEPGRNGKKKEFFFYHNENKNKVTGRIGNPLLYNLPGLAKAKGPAYFTEGEGKADLLIKWDLPATSLDAGSAVDFEKKTEYKKCLEYLYGRESVIILPDNDDVGRAYAERVARVLAGHVQSIKLVMLPGLPEKGDILDWVKDPENTKEKFLAIVESSPTWKQDQPKPETPIKVKDHRWPSPLRAQAFYGLAGEFVEMLEPHTESDPVALLIQFLVGFGNVIGRGTWWKVEAHKHHLNLFCTLVGETSKARKGTSHGQVKAIFKEIDPGWVDNFRDGLTSGEGLIWAIHDEITKMVPIREKGRTIDYQEIIEHKEIKDKRLLVVEEEFAGVLRVMEREANTLSSVIRKSWDGETLNTLAKNSKAKATGAHISIIGHITRDELRQYLTRTETANGFANRFLWLCVKRSNVLPEGGEAHKLNWEPLIHKIESAMDFGKRAGEIRRDDDAREIWARVYPELSEGKPGLLGAVTGRAEAIVMRLACLYAVLDKSFFITGDHLLAGLAVWDYAEASAKYIFGNATGDQVADQILEALMGDESKGMTRTEINRLFTGNKSADRIDQALNLLVGGNLIKKVKEPTEGRPVERWIFI